VLGEGDVSVTFGKGGEVTLTISWLAGTQTEMALSSFEFLDASSVSGLSLEFPVISSVLLLFLGFAHCGWDQGRSNSR
jgi:hypothetical protein